MLRAIWPRIRERAARPPALLALSILITMAACKPRGGDLDSPASARGVSSPRTEETDRGTAASVQKTPQPRVLQAPRLSERWAPYPPGRWRLAPRSALEPVVIWASHILVRHANAADEESFNFTSWKSVAEPVARNREQALERAREIAEQAKRRPGRFEEQARLVSEDITNRERGGRLGGLRASQLLLWPQVLDALAAIAPGEVSDPVETRFGFHIFLREAPPIEETISGRHIVIGHDRAMWSRMTTCQDEPLPRTRDEALRLATDIFQTVRAHPEAFDDAVQRYSEDCDAAIGGDLGNWSTREVAPFERRLDVLRALAIGESAPPRETHVGFEIILRTPVRPRQRLAAQLISVDFSPWVADSAPNSRERARQAAEEMARQLSGGTAQFEAFRGMYRYTESSAWDGGREPATLRAILSSLKPGKITPQPVRVPGAYVLARKLEPTTLPWSPPMMAELDLPSAERVSLQSLLDVLPFQEAAEALVRRSPESSVELQLPHAVAEKLATLLEGWAATSAALALEQRKSQLDVALEQSRALLANDLYERYRTSLEDGLTVSILSRRMPMF